MSIQVAHLQKSYGTTQAVKGISFRAQPGRILGFLGPNGAGKSTTLKMLAGSIPPDAGQASICGFDVLRDSLTARQHVGYLPENNPLYQDMYVHEMLTFAAGIHRISHPRQRIAEVIALTGLESHQYKKINELSKGYRQRVGLAQAILHDPAVLILDEPTSGLDPNQIQDIRSLIIEQGHKKTVLLSTHIMQEVEAVCDDVIILHQGQIVADFPLDELATRYPDPNLESLFMRLTSPSSADI